MYKIKSIKCI